MNATTTNARDGREYATNYVAEHGVAELHVAINGTWSARCSDGSRIYSYEGLDYHTGCREFLQNLVDAGIPVVYHGDIRLDNPPAENVKNRRRVMGYCHM